MKNHDKDMVLPSDITKSHVLTKYRDACLNNGWTAAGRSKFYDVWQSFTSHFLLPSLPLIFVLHVSRRA